MLLFQVSECLSQPSGLEAADAKLESATAWLEALLAGKLHRLVQQEMKC